MDNIELDSNPNETLESLRDEKSEQAGHADPNPGNIQYHRGQLDLLEALLPQEDEDSEDEESGGEPPEHTDLEQDESSE